jgi:hypothetical protein
MSTTAEKTQLIDWDQVETRQTAAGWELLCPECQGWVKALLTTCQGLMCRSCWDQAKTMLRSVPE